MLTQQIKDKLEQNNIWYEDKGGDWIRVHCMNPEHADKHPSAGINKETSLHHCFSCGYNVLFLEQDDLDPEVLWRARYSKLKKDYQEVLSIQEALEIKKDRKKEIFLPPVAHYLDREWRGVPANILKAVNAFYCSEGKYRGRNVFPIYQNNELVGFDARIVDATARNIGAKWIRPRGMQVKDIVYPENLIKSRGQKHLIIVEGVLDALSYWTMGYAAMPTFGMSPPSDKRIETMLMLGISSITLAYDNDEAGRNGILQVYPYYKDWFDIQPCSIVSKVRDSGEKDANDYLIKYSISLDK